MQKEIFDFWVLCTVKSSNWICHSGSHRSLRARRSGTNSGDDTIVQGTKPFRGNLSSHTLEEWSAWGLRRRSVKFQPIRHRFFFVKARKSLTSEFSGVLSGACSTHVDPSFESRVDYLPSI